MLIINLEKTIEFTKQHFIPIMQAFLANKISDADYEKKILAVGTQDHYTTGDDYNDLISNILSDAQVYYSEEPEAGEISLEKLRENCAKYLVQLEKIVADYETSKN